MADEIRIGVFICDCGSNIRGVIDVPELVEFSKTLPYVVVSDEGKWTCSVDYLSRMKDLIKEHSLNRVVVAACTPRTHEPLFKRTVKEAGLNPYLLEFVSIREQASWVHMKQKEEATKKAKDLIKMAVSKAALLEEGEEIRLPVGKESVVIGGGISGIYSALSLANQGFQVTLIEREKELGGILKRLKSVKVDSKELDPKEVLQAKLNEIESNSNIKVLTGYEIKEVDGYIGNFRVKVENGSGSEEIKASTIVVATGMTERKPQRGQFLYGEDRKVLTQLELEQALKENSDGFLNDVKRVVIINCINSRNEEYGCCNMGCQISLKNAAMLKEMIPDSEIFVLYRDLTLPGSEGKIIYRLREKGIKFIRFPDDRYPIVRNDNGTLKIEVFDRIISEALNIDADLLVLTCGFKGADGIDELKGMLKVSSNSEGFLQEAHVKLGPVDFPSDGIYLCGCSRSPKGIKESVDEAMAAAMRASIPMNQGYIEAEGIIAKIDLERCNSCGLCWKRCPFSAIKVDEEKRPHVIEALCKGCGLCAADCPKRCITIVHFREDQIIAQIEAALEEEPQKKIIGFVCHWCALGGVDMAGVSRLQYPPNARLIRVMCSARVSISMIEKAFELGAAGVLVAGCEFPTCHYISGNYAAEKRVNRAKKILKKKGYDPERLWLLWCSAADGPKFADTMQRMVKELGLN